MDIPFNCEKCGQPLTIDESGAGQLVDCPKCGISLEVPFKSKSLAGEARANLRTATATVPPPTVSPTNLQNCPDCGREVSKRAASCPHCGAPINRSLTAFTPNVSPVTLTKDEGVSASTIGWAIILAILFPFVGFFMGVYLLAKKEPKSGVTAIALSIVFLGFWGWLLYS